MFSMLRFFMVVIGLVLIAIGVAAVALSTQLEKYGRAWLEDRLSHLFDTRVELKSLQVAPLQHGLFLEGLTIFNPEGFDARPAMRSERLSLSADPRTLFSDKPALDQLTLERVEVWTDGLGKNLQALLERAAALFAGPSPPLPIRIKKLVCTGGTIHAGPAPVTLRPFELSDIGPGQPLPEAEMTMQFLKNVGLDIVTLKGLLPGLIEAF